MKVFSKYLLLGALASATGTLYAQDSYDAQTFTNSDLNGTARFVAMGGALGALGGDISVMGTNPAGTAMYRKSDAAVSVSELFGGKGAMDHDGHRFSFDQGGILVAFDMDNPTSKGLQFVNFGVNYQKRRNYLFNQITDVQHLNNTFSQTFQIADLCNQAYENDYWAGMLVDMSASDEGFHAGILDESGEYGYEGIPAQKAYYERSTYGANVQADVNLSFNVNDQFFIGASIGVYDINYERESFYQELGIDGNAYDFTNWYKTTGDGFDVKLGFICRPIEDSPFRIGVYAHTPIWYRMTDSNGASLYLNDEPLVSSRNDEYDYKFRTPWKFGVSLGHTVGNNFAIGAEYEFQDLSAAHYSERDNYSLPYFRNINRITKQTLKGQHTIKVGVEYKPIESLSLRVGYNHVTSPFKDGAYRTIGYDGPYTETDWTNWGAINRFTAGVGYRYKGGYFDLAYQYQAQKGDFYAFDNDVDFKSTKIDNNRSQIMATLGFRF
ncbi:MAG: hypothetical protein IJP82_09755 [Bacteroidaceae bacterium]|nr:hypothetical protein [Bacteroidaceae bacterium]